MRVEAGGRPGIRLRHLIVLLLIISAFVDLPADLTVGPVSGMGALTLLEVGCALIAVLALRTYPQRLVYCLAPYGAFLVWAALTTVWAPSSFGGRQNFIVYLLFGLVVALTGTLAARNSDLVERVVRRGMLCIDTVALTIAASCLAVYGLPIEGNPWPMGARAFALFGLPLLAWHVANAHTGRGRHLVWAWVWLLAMGLTLSRTATAVGLLFMGITFLLQVRWNARALLLRGPAIAVATAVIVVVLARGTPMADRLFTGDTSIQVGGVAVNASGRKAIWREVTASAWKAPIIGQGLGSSMGAASRVAGVAHPHNDYMRVWHDAGFLGLGLFCAAFLTMLAALVGNVRRAGGWTGQRSAAVPLAALLALGGVLIASITDNAIIYPFVMTPLAVLVGAGLGLRWERSAGART